MARYPINFNDLSDQHIRAALHILSQKGYQAKITSGADGENWFYHTDRQVDQATRAELSKIGVEIKQ